MTYPQATADPTAVVGRRVVAYLVDVVLLGLLGAMAIYPLFTSQAVTESSARVRCTSSATTDPTSDARTEITSAICVQTGDQVRYIPDAEANGFAVKAYAILGALGLVDLVLLQGLTGASVGKLVLGLRVVRDDGRIAGMGWALLRWALLFVDALCCSLLPGLALVLTTKGHRRLGDMAASTFVVRATDVGQPPLVPGLTAPAYPDLGTYQPMPTGPPLPGGYPADPAATAGGPQWDEARNTYIQYDPASGQWVQWDATASAWRPIDQ